MTKPAQPSDLPDDLIVPKRGDPPATFTPQYQTFLDRQYAEIVPGMNSISAYVNSSNDYIDSQLILAENQVVAAALEATQASGSAQSAAASANFVGEWVDLTGILAFPSSIYHDGNYWVNTSEIADVTASEPSMTNEDYLPISNSDIRFKITTPFTMVRGGNYYISGSGNVTLPDPLTLNGESFKFIASIDSNPKIYGFNSDDIQSRHYSDIDYIEIDNQAELTFIHNTNTNKMEI